MFVKIKKWKSCPQEEIEAASKKHCNEEDMPFEDESLQELKTELSLETEVLEKKRMMEKMKA